ncbi:DUF5977 domain-containing protein [Elizabethkingia anophelis]
MKKIYYTILCFISLQITAQETTNIAANKINVKSPQTYAFEKYGNVPVNLYTGAIDLNIPIFKSEHINLSLSYDSSGFIPSKRSAPVGLNWNFLAGGKITRTVNGIPDEFKGTGSDAIGQGDNGVNSIFGRLTDVSGFMTGTKYKTYNNSSVYNLNAGKTGVNLDWVLGEGPTKYEGEPDLFTFNVMGISGKFMVGNDGKVKVESDDPNIEVDITQFTPRSQSCNITQNVYDSSIYETVEFPTIVIRDGQGNKYYFGGNYHDYEIYFGLNEAQLNGNGMNYKAYPIVNAYNLNKVILANGSIIQYKYKAPEFEEKTKDIGWRDEVCQMHRLTGTDPMFSRVSHFQNFDLLNDHKCATNSSFCKTNNNYTEGGNYSSWSTGIIKYSLLESIKYDGLEVNIKYKRSGNIIKYNPMVSTLETDELLIDNITTTYKGNKITDAYFNYENTGGVDRSFLKEIQEKVSKQNYSFDYYNTAALPTYYTRGVDHWGYWNGRDNNSTLIPGSNYNFETGDYTITGQERDPNPNNYNNAQLRKVIYPTKGYTIFEYEPHYYSKRIERSSQSNFLPGITNNSGMAGGARIKRQTDFSNDGSIIKEKNYKYTTTIDGDSSSGTLTNWPRYFMYFKIKNSNNQTLSTIFKNVSSNLNINSLDSYNVGYSKIYEIENGKGYTEYQFTSFSDQSDISGESNLFQTATPYLDKEMTTVGYFHPLELYKNYNNLFLTDQSVLRGKYKSISVYNQDNSIIKKTDYIYNDNRYFNLNTTKDENNYVAINHMSGLFVQGYKRYFNRATLNKKIVTDYLTNTPIVTISRFYYNSINNLNLSQEELATPDGVNNVTTYEYASDQNNIEMKEANMLGIPIKTENKKNGITISKTEINYKRNNTTSNLVLPTSVKITDLQNPNDPTKVKTDLTYDLYDNKGKLLQYSEKGKPVTVIWGYDQNHPIAKIEGAAYNQVSAYISAIITASDADNIQGTDQSEQALVGALDLFRNNSALSDYQITTYTYNPFIGVTSITPPSGIREVYKYDSANRLESVKDINGNILKEYKYYYNNENPSVNLYYNIEKNKEFIRSNCPDGGSPGHYNYIVPAGKYSSNISQADADQKADIDINQNGQLKANINASCLFYNTQKSKTFTKNNCLSNETPGSYTYIVLAGTYPSFISQADADQKADIDINQYGQLKANENSSCSSVYYNTEKSKEFIRSNCQNNELPSYYTYTVPARKYSSSISQADADQQADIDINQNGQLNANNNALCQTGVCTISPKVNMANKEVSYYNGNINVIIEFYPQHITSINFNDGKFKLIGTISSLCAPKYDIYKEFSEIDNNSRRNWELRVTPSGDISIRLIGPNIPSGSGSHLEFSFPKN